jgi:RNA:NAD 2'-phosphotransferase (TPT1/KptA family)
MNKVVSGGGVQKMAPKRGGGSRAGGAAGDAADVRVSKAMSRLLRHHPPPGAMDAQGWVALPVLLQHLKGASEEQVRRVVDSNDKVNAKLTLNLSAGCRRLHALQRNTCTA